MKKPNYFGYKVTLHHIIPDEVKKILVDYFENSNNELLKLDIDKPKVIILERILKGEERELVCFIVYRKENNKVYIEYVYTAINYRKRGFMQDMFSSFIDGLENTELSCDVWWNNFPSINLFLKLNFELKNVHVYNLRNKQNVLLTLGRKA